MAAFAWVLIATAFLVLVMVANNSWPAIWARLTGNPLTLGGNPSPPEGSGNAIVPTPDPNVSTPLNPTPGATVESPPATTGNAIVPVDPTAPAFTFDPADLNSILGNP